MQELASKVHKDADMGRKWFNVLSTLIMDLATSLEIIPKVIQASFAGLQLNFLYTSIYFKSFQEASRRDWNKMTQSTEIIRDERLTLADRNLDNELKSSVFTSLLSKYINLLVDMSTTLRPDAAKLLPQIDS